jgi:hypothetical protein
MRGTSLHTNALYFFIMPNVESIELEDFGDAENSSMKASFSERPFLSLDSIITGAQGSGGHDNIPRNYPPIELYLYPTVCGETTSRSQ